MHNSDYDWYVKKIETGNVLVVSASGKTPRNIFVGRKKITPAVVAYQIKRFMSKES